MRVGTQGLFRTYLKTFVPAFFPDPTDCPWVSEDATFPATFLNSIKEIPILSLCTIILSMIIQNTNIYDEVLGLSVVCQKLVNFIWHLHIFVSF